MTYVAPQAIAVTLPAGISTQSLNQLGISTELLNRFQEEDYIAPGKLKTEVLAKALNDYLTSTPAK